MNNMPARVATSTSDVPRSGWSMTRIQGGTRMMIEPITVQTDLILASRLARNAANTMIIRILASSLNWSWKPATTIQRADVPALPVLDPNRSVMISNATFSR